jgi:glycosyltransferase involved in cell wall biosynthesis
MSLDMSRPGALAQALAGLTPGWIAEHGHQARARALKMFSQEAVIAQYVAYYKQIVRGEA